jgi:1-aminocyclopropane-1-carboxylate deaminase
MHNKIVTQEIVNDAIRQHGVRLFIKRLDLNHPNISGNKWYKLKYNLEEIKKQEKKGFVTFGGAFSNHIVATAYAGKENNLKTIGFIRGEEHLPLNPSLQFAKDCGMELHYIDRETYRRKEASEFLLSLNKKFPDFYFLPEGGSNHLAVKGCMEILNEEDSQFDYICCSCGTGTTLAGLILGMKDHQTTVGFSSLKGSDFINENVKKLMRQLEDREQKKWTINHDYHFGGYAKVDKSLINFVNDFNEKHHVQLDYIYTGKMMYGIQDLVAKKFFQRNKKILAIHSGGLQGNKGIMEKLV